MCPFSLSTQPPMAVIDIFMENTGKSGVFNPEFFPEPQSMDPDAHRTFLYANQCISNSTCDPGPHLYEVPYPCFPGSMRLSQPYHLSCPCNLTGHQKLPGFPVSWLSTPIAIAPLQELRVFVFQTFSRLTSSPSVLLLSRLSAVLRSHVETSMPLGGNCWRFPVNLPNRRVTRSLLLALPPVLFPTRKPRPFHVPSKCRAAPCRSPPCSTSSLPLPTHCPRAGTVPPPLLPETLPSPHYVSFRTLISSPASRSPSWCLRFPALISAQPSWALLSPPEPSWGMWHSTDDTGAQWLSTCLPQPRLCKFGQQKRQMLSVLPTRGIVPAIQKSFRKLYILLV